MAKSFETLLLGNLPLIETAKGNQDSSQTALNSWLGTYGSSDAPLANDLSVKVWGDNAKSTTANSSDRFTVGGVQHSHGATVSFDAVITFFDETTATVTAVIVQAANGDCFVMPGPQTSEHRGFEVKSIQSLTLVSPLHANGNSRRGYSHAANQPEENLVACFVLGTWIATNRGEKRIEDLKVGDLVMTRDNGLQPIRWIGRRDVTEQELRQTPEWAPIKLEAGSLGGSSPETDLLLSPNHRVLMTGNRATLLFGESEVLVAAEHLTDMDGISKVATSGVSYFHILFESHQVVLSNGAWTESFQPADCSIRGLGDDQLIEVLGLFPELADTAHAVFWPAARRVLERHEAQQLTS